MVAAAGDPELVASLRSSSKPLQALPLARARADLGDGRPGDRLRVALRRRRMHVAAVRAPAAQRPAAARRSSSAGSRRAGRRSRSTTTAPASTPGCSPSAARAAGRSRATASPATRCSGALHEEVAAAAGLDEDEVETAIDGCGVVCLRAPARAGGRAFSRLEQLDGGDRIAAAMRAHPELIGGAGGDRHRLMRALPGWVAKGGAEGLMCAGSADGIGIALKSADGNPRPLRPALAAFASALGLDLAALRRATRREQPGRAVGDDAQFVKKLFRIVEFGCNIRRGEGRLSRSGTVPGSLFVSRYHSLQPRDSRRSSAHCRHFPPGRRRAPQARPGRDSRRAFSPMTRSSPGSKRSSSPRSRSRTSTPI